MTFANLRIGARLTMGFGVMVLLIAISNVMLGRINAGTNEIVHGRMPKIEAASTMQASINDIAIALRNMLLNSDAADRKLQIDRIMLARQSMSDTVKTLDATLVDTRARTLLNEMKTSLERYTAGQDELIRRIQAGNDEGARAYLSSDLRPQLERLKKATSEQSALQKEISLTFAQSAAATYDESRLLTWSLGAAALAFAAVVAWWITKSITRPVNRALTIANTVAAGDLTSRIDVETTDEMGQLLQALKTMNDSLANTVGTVRTGTETIATAASEVATGSMDLSSRTEQQASSLEETASSMEQLTATVKQNADNARQANALANTASEVAARGGNVIDQVTGTMEEINASSRKITDIISVIDGIAFQTNILALNAAVEAARAGEEGRGFAVVASEVRNLAQRSATAAREIKELIEASTSRVDSGSRLVSEASATMREIVDSVQRVTDIMAEIASANGEQTAGIEQINRAVVDMDGVTQQNAALVEQAAAAADAMQEQAKRLAQAVAIFRIDGNSASAGRESAAWPAETVAHTPQTIPTKSPRLAKPATVRPEEVGRATAQRAGDWEEF